MKPAAPEPHDSDPRPTPAHDPRRDEARGYAWLILRRVGLRPLLAVLVCLALAAPDHPVTTQAGAAEARATARASARIVGSAARVGPVGLDTHGGRTPAPLVRPRERRCDPPQPPEPAGPCRMIVYDMP